MKKLHAYSFVPAVFLLAVFILACATENSTQNLIDRSKGYRDVGREYIVQGKYTLALRELLKAEKLYADDHVLQDYMGICYREKEKYQQALEHFNKALAIKPDYGIARNNLGTTYLKMNSWDKAIEQFKMLTEGQYVDIYVTPHYPLANLGLAYYQKGDYEKAAVYYTDALDYYRDGFTKDYYYKLVVIGLARTKIAQADFREAISLLKNLTEEYPDQARIHFELANVYRDSGNFGAALISYRRVVQLAPETPIADASVEEIERLGNPSVISE